MSKHAFLESFRDLIVYQKSRAVSKTIFQLTKTFPKEETYSLTDQIRRSSRSIGAQIAEAWAKRRYPNHFALKLSDAEGEQQETQHWLGIAVDCEYLAIPDAEEIRETLQEIGRMLQRMIDCAEDFKGDDHGRVREQQATYGSLDEFFDLNTEN